MPHLYINAKGMPWKKHSYSAGNTFDQSPYKYFLQKILGWKEKDNKARFLFGHALEEAVQFHHEHEGKGAVEDFTQRWLVHKENAEISYTKTEKDWENLNVIGQEMLQLYTVMQPSLPIPLGGQTIWQREYLKEVFPGDPNYGEIEDAGRLDIVAYVDPAHPKLRKIEWKPEYGVLRPIIIDIKTAATDFPEEQGMAGFDVQLRRYSWLSGIRDVGLLWFKKTSRGLKKGSSVTLLTDSLLFEAGEEAVIAKTDEDKIWLVKNDFMIEEMNRAQGFKEGKQDQTNAAKARAAAWLEKFGEKIHASVVTKQRIQFNSGYVSKKSADGAGCIAARQIEMIVRAWKQFKETKDADTAYPNTFGIRFPKDDRHDPYFIAFVRNDQDYKDRFFKKTDEDEDLFKDETPEEE